MLVTGAGGGIGLGIVHAFAEAGALIFAVVRRLESVERVKSESLDAHVLLADLADKEAPQMIVDSALDAYGRVDVLINNAAEIAGKPLSETTADFIDRQSAVNLRAPLLLSRHFAAACEAGGRGGKIINVTSIEGFVATMPEGLAAYSATKTALRGMTVSLDRELSAKGISVNAIAPGGVMHDNLAREGQEQRTDAEVQAVLDSMRARASIGRFGTPADIANVCLFLASPASDYIRGQTLVADGGYTLG